jgi:uncharacterized protein YoaH (UPF0181 family)
MRESTRQRLAFNLYVSLGSNRSLELLRATIAGDPVGHGFTRVPAMRSFFRWSAELRWQDRLADLEREARIQDAENLLQELKEMNQRQAREGLLLQQKAIAKLQTLLDEEMATSDAIRALAEGARLERLARGEVTERTMQERNDEIDLSGFSIAELRALAEIAAARASGNRQEEPE